MKRQKPKVGCGCCGPSDNAKRKKNTLPVSPASNRSLTHRSRQQRTVINIARMASFFSHPWCRAGDRPPSSRRKGQPPPDDPCNKTGASKQSSCYKNGARQVLRWVNARVDDTVWPSTVGWLPKAYRRKRLNASTGRVLVTDNETEDNRPFFLPRER